MKDYQDFAIRLEGLEAQLLNLVEDWRTLELEGKDFTAVEGALFLAAQKVGLAVQRLTVLAAEAATKEREQPSLRFAEGGTS